MYIGLLYVQCRLLFLSDCNDTCICSTRFQQNPQIQNFMKIRPVRAELLHGTDGHEVNLAFRNFAIAPKNSANVSQNT